MSKHDIEWGVSFDGDDEARYYGSDGAVVRHVGTDEAAHHAPSHGYTPPVLPPDRPRSATRPPCPACADPMSTSRRCLNPRCRAYGTRPMVQRSAGGDDDVVRAFRWLADNIEILHVEEGT